MGTEPPAAGEQTSTVDIFAEAAARAQSVHDELWASGRIKDGMSEKEKAIEYSKWMSINCSYASNDTAVSVYGQKSWVVDYAYGPLVLGYGECDGLSKAYKELLDTEGISCELKQSTSHMW